MSEFVVSLVYKPSTNTFDFSGAADSNGDIPVDVGGTEERWIAFELSGADEIIGIKIAQSQAALAYATPQSSGEYGGTCFKDLELSQDETAFKMRDTGSTTETWFYKIGILYQGQEKWPDPKIQNQTSSGGGGRGGGPGLFFG
jgi:hypothetical protein